MYRLDVPPSGVASPIEPATLPTIAVDHNPASQVVGITYTLPTITDVRLTVFDVTGRVTDELVSTSRVAGAHAVAWDAKARPSGVYFAVLLAQGEMVVSKIVLTK